VPDRPVAAYIEGRRLCVPVKESILDALKKIGGGVRHAGTERERKRVQPIVDEINQIGEPEVSQRDELRGRPRNSDATIARAHR